MNFTVTATFNGTPVARTFDNERDARIDEALCTTLGRTPVSLDITPAELAADFPEGFGGTHVRIEDGPDIDSTGDEFLAYVVYVADDDGELVTLDDGFRSANCSSEDAAWNTAERLCARCDLDEIVGPRD